MRFSEIRKKYRDQWVLVEYSKLDKELRVKDGKVLAHASSKEDIYKALLQTKGKNVAIEYCGKLPDDRAVMFCLDLSGSDSPQLAVQNSSCKNVRHSRMFLAGSATWLRTDPSFGGNPGEILTGPPIKTFGGDNFRKILMNVF